MDTLSYKTLSVNKENSSKEWVVIDATDLVLGRLASRVAILLRGKNKPNFTPNADCGDNVIILNADKVRLTGKIMNYNGTVAEMKNGKITILEEPAAGGE